ncbi:MAG: TniQ family protein [Burkholderiaceae bacterium]|nr:TniQ family protein [Burkholderiaceae bacterium]
MHPNPSRFLARPSQLPDESLSSWRQRTAWANGYRLFPIPNGHLRRSDPDMGFNEAELQWVAALHDTTVDACHAMTLSGQIGRFVSHVASRSQPRWWLRSRYGMTDRHHGSMYCPHCLEEDSSPYFRLSWRLGFTTVCTKHEVLLTDQCPQCGRAPWPSACAIGSHISPRFGSFDQCPYCDYNLTNQTMSRLASPTVVDFAATRPETLAGLFQADIVESLLALRSICHLFIRNRPRRAIIDSGSRWSAIARAVSPACLVQNSIEHAPVNDRHLLITASVEICKSWPNSFCDFAVAAGVTRAHFNGSTSIHPIWMNNVIDERLALQNRFITAADKLLAFNQLTAALGRRPSKFELRRALKWQGDKGLDALFDDI